MPFNWGLCAWIDLKHKTTYKAEGSQIALPGQDLESWCYKPPNKPGTFSQITTSDWIMKKNNLLVGTTQRG